MFKIRYCLMWVYKLGCHKSWDVVLGAGGGGRDRVGFGSLKGVNESATHLQLGPFLSGQVIN